MWVYIIIFIAGGIIITALQQQILYVLRWCIMGLGVLFGWHIVQLLLDHESMKPIFIGGISAFVVCLLMSAHIRHTLIYFYLKRTIQRDKDAAQAGKLW